MQKGALSLTLCSCSTSAGLIQDTVCRCRVPCKNHLSECQVGVAHEGVLTADAGRQSRVRLMNAQERLAALPRVAGLRIGAHLLHKSVHSQHSCLLFCRQTGPAIHPQEHLPGFYSPVSCDRAKSNDHNPHPAHRYGSITYLALLCCRGTSARPNHRCPHVLGQNYKVGIGEVATFQGARSGMHLEHG